MADYTGQDMIYTYEELNIGNMKQMCTVEINNYYYSVSYSLFITATLVRTRIICQLYIQQ